MNHDNMRNTIDKFHDNINSLSSFADQIRTNKSQNSVKMIKKYEDIKNRLKSASSTVDRKLKMLHESQLFFNFLMQTNRVSNVCFFLVSLENVVLFIIQFSWHKEEILL